MKAYFNTTIIPLLPVFSLFHHSVQLFVLLLCNRLADAKPGIHSRTAGV